MAQTADILRLRADILRCYARTARNIMLSRMMLFVCDAFNVLSCSRCFCLQFPGLSFVADPVTVHARVRLLINFTELNFHLSSKVGNNCLERNIM